MKYCRFLVIFILIVIKTETKLINKQILENERNPLTDEMREFMKFVIDENSHEKDGFLLIMINKIEPEFSDFATQELNRNNSVTILNFDIDKITKPMLNPNHFKFVLTDPEGDLSHAQSSFNKVRSSRAKIVLILTKPPLLFFLKFLMDSYMKIQCINVIIAYEIDNRIEVHTMNPYSTKNKYINLTSTKYTEQLFQEKGRNLHGYQINALLTYNDRTKVHNNQGKDFIIMQTIFSHLNGKLNVIKLNNQSIGNPWLSSMDNQTELNLIKRNILNDLKISILIKSESFTINDGIVENLNPHRQNDLAVLVPKSPKISLFKANSKLMTPGAWILYYSIVIGIFIVLVLIEKHTGCFVGYFDVYFTIHRLNVTNNLQRMPKNSFEKLLIFGLLIFFFLINTGLQSKTTSLLTIKSYEPEIDTIEELARSKLQIYALPNDIIELNKKYSNTKYEKFAKSLIVLNLNVEELENLIFENITNINKIRKISSLIAEQDLAVMIVNNRLLYNQNLVPIYHLVKESLIPSYQSFKTVHGLPLLPILNQQLLKLQEDGFIDLWSKRHIYQEIIHGNLYSTDLSNDTPIEPLTLKSIKFAFYCLGGGYIAAITSFLIELKFR